ncbi:MAG: tetratricopeptide repeat protein [Candidatus Hodarchaeota archaeon]
MSQEEEFIEKAIKFKREEKFEDALDILKALLKRNPQSINAKVAFIEVLFEYGIYLNDEWVLEYAKAEECFKKVIVLAPENYRAWYNLGIAYFNQNKMDEALNAYNRAIEIKPEYFYIYYNIGLIYEFNKKDLYKALQYYEKALSYNNDFVYAIQAKNIVKKKLEMFKQNEDGRVK